MNYRLENAVKNQSSVVQMLSTDCQPVRDNLKSWLRRVADELDFLSQSDVVANRSKKQILKPSDDQSTSSHVKTV